jgi:SAM-dependent methyltransferase
VSARSQPSSWTEFFDGDHPIYVNARHLQTHYERQARDLLRLLEGRVRPRLLDFGCGDALAAPALASAGAEVWLYDAAPAVRERLVRRFAGAAGITVLGGDAWESLPAGSFDVALVNSVLQYLDTAATEALVDRLARLLAPGGEVLLTDVVPPGFGLGADLWALLAPATRHGYLGPALLGLGRTFFSSYRGLRRTAGFATWSEAAIQELARRHGLVAHRSPFNVGFNPRRMTFRLRAGAGEAVPDAARTKP